MSEALDRVVATGKKLDANIAALKKHFAGGKTVIKGCYTWEDFCEKYHVPTKLYAEETRDVETLADAAILEMKQFLRPSQRSRKTGAGEIYFIRGVITGRIKIGFTRCSVEQRRADLQTASSESLVIAGRLVGTPQDERRFHQRFKGSRVCGEWFQPTPELVALIKGAK